MSTQFGFLSRSTSPARQRIEQSVKRVEIVKDDPPSQDEEAAVLSYWTPQRRNEVKQRRAKEILAQTAHRAASRPSHPVRLIVAEVAARCGVTIADIRSTRRAREIVEARHEVFWRCRHETSHSLPAIARLTGNFDHTTVLYGIRRYEERMARAARLAA